MSHVSVNRRRFRDMYLFVTNGVPCQCKQKKVQGMYLFVTNGVPCQCKQKKVQENVFVCNKRCSMSV